MGSKSDENFKAKLIANVKKEVKQVMEESVTRKFVHEESGSVTALCGAVEACLSQGLRRRALGLFKTSSTTALLHKIAKHSPEAAIISKKLQQIENSDPNRRSSSSSDSLTKPTLKKNASFHGLATTQPKHLWIRLALFERNLPKVIDFLVQNASKYYERDSLVADADYGSILCSLLVGPCALDYSKTRNQSFWSDPPADELVQRHRISSSASTPPSVRRPILNFKRSLNASSEDSGGLRGSSQLFAKDYVESLHQNAKESLIFGKNNVLISPQKAGNSNLIPGYLSLHQNVDGLTLKWTPNQLINGFKDDEECLKNVNDKSVYWDYALTVRLDEIVYVHCHRENDTGGTIILVGQDGVQRPPIHFPKGGHMLAFLSCVETGLLPRGRLDPPLWSQRNNNNKKRRPLATLGEKNEENDGDETFLVKKKEDLVFRIIDHREIGLKRNQLMDTHVQFPSSKSIKTNSSTSSESSTKSLSIDQSVININNITVQDGYSPPSIQAVCDSMKRQIISRAFYGWLAYCRHLSTVRRHLTGLVNSKIINDEVGAKDGVTIEKWREICNEGVITDRGELYKLVYFGGIHHDLRKEIWPYLLGHYKFGSNIDERVKLSEETKQAYENTMSEWLAVEAIVRQRDKESQANAIAKLSSDSISGNEVPKQIQRDLSNDVFEDFSSFSDEDDPKIITHPQNDDENDVLSKENVTQHDLDCLKKERLLKEYSTTSSTKAQISEFSSIDTEYSSKETESSEVTEIQDMEKCQNVNEGKFVTPEMTTEDFDVNNVIVTTASVDLNQPEVSVKTFESLTAVKEENSLDTLDCIDSHGLVSPSVSACVSPASSNGGVYTQELLESFGQNLHRIDKDVQRCDRNYWYFTNENLEKLRNVMCTYVWEHLEIGYMQGMCDLVAPLLVIFNDESLTYACFCRLMERMVENFPSGNAMDCHFANMRSLIQILDAEIYELMQSHGDYTHFYFCYRWFLLDFKREMVYDDVYATWETIWAAREVASGQFVLFLALALLETYRDIILSNGMDFTDIIKFFNEMAERHDASAVLRLARDLVLQLQLLIENK